MPCYDPRDRTDAIETEQRMQRATKTACEALGLLEAMGFDMKRLTPEAQIWWREHKKWDKFRVVASGVVPNGTVEFYQDGKLLGRITNLDE